MTLAQGLGELGLDHIGDGGVAIALITLLIVFLWVVKSLGTKVLDVWAENNRARNANDADRIKAEDRQAQALEHLEAQLALNHELNGTMLELMQAFRTELGQSAQAMRKRADARDQRLVEQSAKVDALAQRLALFPKVVRDAVQPVKDSLDTLPTTVQASLDALQANLIQTIVALKAEIDERLDRMSDTLNGASRQTVQREIQAHLSTIESQVLTLTQFLHQLDTFAPPHEGEAVVEPDSPTDARTKSEEENDHARSSRRDPERTG